MKKDLIYAAAALLALAALVSCSRVKELEEPVISLSRTITITAFQAEENPGSKTTLDNGGTEVFWQPGDAIKLFRGSDGTQLTADISENSKVAEFSGPEPAGDGEFIAVYPSNLASSCTDGVVSITIPGEQTAVAGSFAPGTYITMGHSETTEMGFYSVCGGFRFTLSQEGIRRVVFETVGGEKVSGSANVAFVDGKPALQDPASTLTRNRIVLKAPDGEYFQTGKWYYIVAAPAELSQGYKLTFCKDGSWGSKTYDKAVTIKRGVFGSKENVDSGVNFAEFKAVDLGLSVKWATCNVGAFSPEEYGDYFAWGETEPKDDYSWATYKFELGTDYNGPFSKYVTYSSYGTVDNKVVLDLEDDVAHVNLGESWRMPTHEEWIELRENCTWTWTDNYMGTGATGRIVTSNMAGYDDKSIFLPTAGFWRDTFLSFVDYGGYWSASLGSGPYARRVFFDSYDIYIYTNASNRCNGHSIRPVEGAVVPVSGIEIQASLDLSIRETASLTATVAPENATYKSVSWASSDESVATVDATGTVTGISIGKATITVYSADASKTASCEVTVKEKVKVDTDANGHEYVDLGLSVKWATCNVGATRPEECGDYFAWGETEPKSDYSWETYKWCNGTSSTLTKYNTDNSRGAVDNKTSLDPEDDAASVNWGGSWRMPTEAEQRELNDNCTLTWTSDYNGSGISGMIVTSNVTGYIDKSIFIPAASGRDSTPLGGMDSRGYYWSSSLFTDVTSLSCYNADILYFYSINVFMSISDRYLGLSVRPVTE